MKTCCRAQGSLYSVMTYMGKKSKKDLCICITGYMYICMDICICITDSPCCADETNTSL